VSDPQPDVAPPHPTFAEATRVWVRVAAQSFGGPAGQIAVMHRLVVEEQRWIGEQRFLHALNYCMLLPGPEAQQLATYLGWLLHGRRGGLVAGLLFVLPGFLAILALSALYAAFHDVGVVAGALFGVKAAVLAVVLEAVQRIGRRVLTNGATRAVAAAAFVAIAALHVPFPAIVVAAALVGVVGERVAPSRFVVIAPPRPLGAPTPVLDVLLDARSPALPSTAATLRTAAGWLVVWLGPVAALVAALGPDHVLARLATFFSGVATVTFGGAYAALAYVAQQAVEHHHWLRPTEMLDGLGMAETTPGPLIQVVQFVGFLAAFRHPGALSPWTSALAGSVVVTWVTYAPCFLWIFTGAPYVEWLRGSRKLTAALSTITAAVVGVILNLAVYLAGHVLVEWPPGGGLPSPSWGALAIFAYAALALLRWHRGMLEVLGVAALAGLLLSLA
jgi:chromate transporter